MGRRASTERRAGERPDSKRREPGNREPGNLETGDRLACIHLPAFPLQLLLRRERAWAGRPVVVVAEDKSQARILWLNERARGHGILPGMRYSAGLALCAELCAGVVAPAEIERGVGFVARVLRASGPDVEPHPDEPGVFWLGARGLDLLHPSLRRWAAGIRGALKRHDLWAGVVVGATRFFTYALARSLRDSRTWVLAGPDEERTHGRRVRLDRLGLDPAARDGLHALGIETVGDLLRLPAAGLRDRFGDAALALWRAARGEEALPLQPEEEEEALREEVLLDDAEKDVSRLLFQVKRLLDPLLARLANRQQALTRLTLELKLEVGMSAPPQGLVEPLKPADPTLDARQLLDLVLLRLQALKLGSSGGGVIELALSVEGVKATQRQLELFSERTRRDPDAQKRAFARLRAEFGDHAVVAAGLREGHLPEAAFSWKPLVALPPPKPRLCRRTLVRRLRSRPFALPYRPRHEDDGWQLRGRDDAAVEKLEGPYVVSGGWWRAALEKGEVAREYFFARTRKDEWLWVYRDRHRRRWYLHGRVE